MVSFQVTTHYPDGSFITMDQIIHVSWCERKIKDGDVTKIVPRMLVIHISDLYRKHEDDNIYPVHLNEIYKDHIPVTDTGIQVTLSDGKELPIPEKKYTAFKKTVYDRLTETNA